MYISKVRVYKPTIDLTNLDGPLDEVLFGLRLLKGLRDRGIIAKSKLSTTKIMDTIDKGQPYPQAWIDVLGSDFEYVKSETVEGYFL